MTTDQFHGWIIICCLLTKNRTGKYRVVPALFAKVHFNLLKKTGKKAHVLFQKTHPHVNKHSATKNIYTTYSSEGSTFYSTLSTQRWRNLEIQVLLHNSQLTFRIISNTSFQTNSTSANKGKAVL